MIGVNAGKKLGRIALCLAFGSECRPFGLADLAIAIGIGSHIGLFPLRLELCQRKAALSGRRRGSIRGGGRWGRGRGRRRRTRGGCRRGLREGRAGGGGQDKGKQQGTDHKALFAVGTSREGAGWDPAF
ncbi:hypothetical protein GCM10007874_28520 [Labrys miyagiensis]|uniref:Uncharacterized protein n=1 Tax=Labrys miyagiensis TaxID=346912 RepID=A0ABQ6CI67_9HYPH|nr:hypothetical protein GCM10007874_28520 [Labrys miyagiensis]